MPQTLTILVTGASSGIGRATARHLAEAGHTVFGTSRRPSPSDEHPFEMVAMDVRDAASVDGCVASLLKRGPIDVVVNNAGVGVAGPLEQTSDEEALLQIDTNLLGVHRVCRAVLPSMRARGSGRIVNVGSMAGRITLPFQGLYSASKHALEAYTESLRMELHPFGIHATVIEPGDFATSFTQNRHHVKAYREDSPYRERMAACMEIYERDEQAGGDPAMVAATIERAIRARRPKIRYVVAAVPLQKLAFGVKWLLSDRMFERIMHSTYKTG